MTPPVAHAMIRSEHKCRFTIAIKVFDKLCHIPHTLVNDLDVMQILL